MRILIVTPAPPGSRTGNRLTALRWARIQRRLGHAVRVVTDYDDQRCDLLIALHARRSAGSVRRFHTRHPDQPCILALTGTDLYRDIRRSATARSSLERASHLLLLQPDGLRYLPAALRGRAHVIYQSATGRRQAPLKRVFEVCVMGHLRWEKDPFRAALAVRRAPCTSRIQIVHLGAALSPRMQQRAEAEMRTNPRYRWLGELPHGRAKQRLARARLLVQSSRIEGAANSLSEALAARVPILSSRISGSIGLLGDDFPGYFPVGDTALLAQLLLRAERDQRWYRQLAAGCRSRAVLVSPRREQADWARLLRAVGG